MRKPGNMTRLAAIMFEKSSDDFFLWFSACDVNEKRVVCYPM